MLHTIGAIVIIALVLLLIPIIKLLKKPIKWALKILIHAGLGFLTLVVLNFFGSIIGLSIEITWINALIAGVLGLPGVILLIIMTYMV